MYERKYLARQMFNKFEKELTKEELRQVKQRRYYELGYGERRQKQRRQNLEQHRQYEREYKRKWRAKRKSEINNTE